MSTATRSPRLGLPAGVTACLFDLDGVLTDTAALHRRAWKQAFDTYLRERATRTGEAFVPFDAVGDYARHVDGKRRADGVRDFLTSRSIVLPEGEVADPPSAETVRGVGNAKNALLNRLIAEEGVTVFPGSRRYLAAVRGAGLATALVSSSANAARVLEVTGLAAHLDVRVDGVTARERALPGKPAPDLFLEAARELGVAPGAAAVFEDALAGVAAGRAGGFGLVVGVDRLGQAEELRRAGADVVVEDLEELL
ncbi:MAG: beta-phosphoglucomutase family hydrolase [Georgenia sp.]